MCMRVVIGTLPVAGFSRIERPAGNSESWDDDKSCRGWYTFEASEFQILGATMAKLRAPNEVQTNETASRLVFDNLRERVEWWACKADRLSQKCVLYFQRAVCSTIQTCSLDSH